MVSFCFELLAKLYIGLLIHYFVPPDVKVEPKSWFKFYVVLHTNTPLIYLSGRTQVRPKQNCNTTDKTFHCRCRCRYSRIGRNRNAEV